MDFEIIRFCNHLGCGGSLDLVCLWVCEVWVMLTLWLGLIALAVYFDRPRARAFLSTLGLAFLLHFVVSEALLKHALGLVFPLRMRPYLAHPTEIVPLGFQWHDSSFPSSHNATSAAFATVYAMYYPRTAPLAVAFVLLMAFARMHSGMHYPTDVLTGLLLGVGYALAARALLDRRKLRAQTP